MEDVVEYRIFISSPGDVAEERDIAEETILEVNEIIRDPYKIQFRPLRWENDVFPGLSADGPQGVVEKQVGDNYDIYLGIMGARFGTPTREKDSGTEQEFDNAFGKWKYDEESVDILLYFKENAGKVSEIDPTQLAKVQNFQKRVEELGFYKKFSDTTVFSKTLRADLLKLAVKLNQKKPEKLSSASADASEKAATEGNIAELGIIEAARQGTESFSEADRIIFELADITATNNESIELRTRELEEYSKGEPDLEKVQQIFDNGAQDLDQFSSEVSSRIPSLSSNLRSGFVYYERLLEALIESEFQKTELAKSTIYKIAQTYKGLSDAVITTSEFRDGILGLPVSTTNFNKSKREAVAVLGELIQSYTKLRDTSKTVLDSMAETLGIEITY